MQQDNVPKQPVATLGLSIWKCDQHDLSVYVGLIDDNHPAPPCRYPGSAPHIPAWIPVFTDAYILLDQLPDDLLH